MSKKYYKVTILEVATMDYYVDPDSSETEEEIIDCVMHDEWSEDTITSVAYRPISSTQITQEQFEQAKELNNVMHSSSRCPEYVVKKEKPE